MDDIKRNKRIMRRRNVLITLSFIMLAVTIALVVVLCVYPNGIDSGNNSNEFHEPCTVKFYYTDKGLDNLFHTATVEYGEAIGDNLPDDVPLSDREDYYCYTFNYWYTYDGTGNVKVDENFVVVRDLSVRASFKEHKDRHIFSILNDEYKDSFMSVYNKNYICEICEVQREQHFHYYEGTIKLQKDEYGHQLVDYVCNQKKTHGSILDTAETITLHNVPTHLFEENSNICLVCGKECHLHNFVDGYCRECNDYKHFYTTVGKEEQGPTTGDKPDDLPPDISNIDSLGFMNWEDNVIVSYPLWYTNADYPTSITPDQYEQCPADIPQVSVMFASNFIAHSFKVTVKREKEPYGVLIDLNTYRPRICYVITIEPIMLQDEDGEYYPILEPSVITDADISLISTFGNRSTNLKAGFEKYDYGEQIIGARYLAYVYSTDVNAVLLEMQDEFYHSFFNHISLKVDTSKSLGNRNKLNIRTEDLKGNAVSDRALPVSEIIDVVYAGGNYYYQIYLHTDFNYTIHSFENTDMLNTSKYPSIEKISKTTKYGGTYYMKATRKAVGYAFKLILRPVEQSVPQYDKVISYYIYQEDDDGNLTVNTDYPISESVMSRYGFHCCIYKDSETGRMVLDYYCTSYAVMHIVLSHDIKGQDQIGFNQKDTFIAYPFVGMIEYDEPTDNYFIVVRLLVGIR